METPAHKRLKGLAAAYLLAHRCPAVATEVACPIARYRVDAAGWLDPLPAAARLGPHAAGAPARGRRATTVFIECKAERGDFLRDGRSVPRLLAARARLEHELARVRAEFVRPLEPELRGEGEFLFPELEAWDYAASRSHAHRLLTAELQRLEDALYAHTKFFTVAQHRLATYLYILAPRGLVGQDELPRGWGLLEAGAEPTAGPAGVGPAGVGPVGVVVPAPAHEPSDRNLARVLRNIAAAATRFALRPA